MPRTVDDLRQALDAGEWLRPADAALVIGVSKSVVVRMLTADPPKMRYRVKAGTGRHRECHPDDVRREMEARHQVHGE
ncbi:hypothetical protein [Micromonospora sp. KC213]|uniref:hypothetical protein n=1 Tax=Micromonospora sp. KC213 TaxID=2530378 RepID=UPI00104D5A90|nr:hypothetical protein [Micromonospora sp. KC213]TDC42106.1 hypothetical protein E1166_09115 [Micromonospora sp. KC213]